MTRMIYIPCTQISRSSLRIDSLQLSPALAVHNTGWLIANNQAALHLTHAHTQLRRSQKACLRPVFQRLCAAYRI